MSLMISGAPHKVKNLHALSLQETHPLLKRLCERILKWRQEINLNTRPDLEGLQEAFELAQKREVEENFFVYVVGSCEWYFRIDRPGSVVLRKEIKRRLNTPGYSPYDPSPLYGPPIQTGVPSPVNRYVDKCLGELWNGKNSEGSRFLLGRDVERLVKEFDKPFLVSELHALPLRRGGYPCLAPWVASTVIYCKIKQTYQQKQDKGAIEASLALMRALKGQIIDPSYFHRKRRKIEIHVPQLVDAFEGGFRNFTKAHGETIERLLERDDLMEIAWYFLDHYREKLITICFQ